MTGQLLLYSLLSLFLSSAGAWLISKFGHRVNLLDRPNERSSHNTTTPKGGGVGILAGFVTVAVAIRLPAIFWVPAAILSVISFWGDRHEISPSFRLLYQFTASLIFLAGFWHAHLFLYMSFLMILPFSIFIVATANYYNFMDGINGISGITGVVGFGLLSFFCFSSGADPALMTLNFCLALGCLGFLPFNLPRAKVFMGDVGSILLGFVFAAMVIWLSKDYRDLVCLASFLFPYYADELTTELVRLKDGEKLWMAHRKHLYQLLANEYGIPHWKVSLGYGLAQLLVGASILYFSEQGLSTVLSILFLYFVVFSVISLVLRKRLTLQSAT